MARLEPPSSPTSASQQKFARPEPITIIPVTTNPGSPKSVNISHLSVGNGEPQSPTQGGEPISRRARMTQRIVDQTRAFSRATTGSPRQGKEFNKNESMDSESGMKTGKSYHFNSMFEKESDASESEDDSHYERRDQSKHSVSSNLTKGKYENSTQNRWRRRVRVLQESLKYIIAIVLIMFLDMLISIVTVGTTIKDIYDSNGIDHQHQRWEFWYTLTACLLLDIDLAMQIFVAGKTFFMRMKGEEREEESKMLCGLLRSKKWRLTNIVILLAWIIFTCVIIKLTNDIVSTANADSGEKAEEAEKAESRLLSVLRLLQDTEVDGTQQEAAIDKAIIKEDIANQKSGNASSLLLLMIFRIMFVTYALISRIGKILQIGTEQKGKNVLDNILGNLFRIKSENLKFNALKGDVKAKNLEFNIPEWKKLHSPFIVKIGFIEKIEVKLPVKERLEQLVKQKVMGSWFLQFPKIGKNGKGPLDADLDAEDKRMNGDSRMGSYSENGPEDPKAGHQYPTHGKTNPPPKEEEKFSVMVKNMLIVISPKEFALDHDEVSHGRDMAVSNLIKYMRLTGTLTKMIPAKNRNMIVPSSMVENEKQMFKKMIKEKLGSNLDIEFHNVVIQVEANQPFVRKAIQYTLGFSFLTMKVRAFEKCQVCKYQKQQKLENAKDNVSEVGGVSSSPTLPCPSCPVCCSAGRENNKMSFDQYTKTTQAARTPPPGFSGFPSFNSPSLELSGLLSPSADTGSKQMQHASTTPLGPNRSLLNTGSHWCPHHGVYATPARMTPNIQLSPACRFHNEPKKNDLNPPTRPNSLPPSPRRSLVDFNTKSRFFSKNSYRPANTMSHEEVQTSLSKRDLSNLDTALKDVKEVDKKEEDLKPRCALFSCHDLILFGDQHYFSFVRHVQPKDAFKAFLNYWDQRAANPSVDGGDLHSKRNYAPSEILIQEQINREERERSLRGAGGLYILGGPNHPAKKETNNPTLRSGGLVGGANNAHRKRDHTYLVAPVAINFHMITKRSGYDGGLMHGGTNGGLHHMYQKKQDGELFFESEGKSSQVDLALTQNQFEQLMCLKKFLTEWNYLNSSLMTKPQKLTGNETKLEKQTRTRKLWIHAMRAIQIRTRGVDRSFSGWMEIHLISSWHNHYIEVRIHQETLIFHQQPRDPFFDEVVRDIRTRLPLSHLLFLEAVIRQRVIDYINEANAWRVEKNQRGEQNTLKRRFMRIRQNVLFTMNKANPWSKKGLEADINGLGEDDIRNSQGSDKDLEKGKHNNTTGINEAQSTFLRTEGSKTFNQGWEPKPFDDIRYENDTFIRVKKFRMEIDLAGHKSNLLHLGFFKEAQITRSYDIQWAVTSHITEFLCTQADQPKCTMCDIVMIPRYELRNMLREQKFDYGETENDTIGIISPVNTIHTLTPNNKRGNYLNNKMGSLKTLDQIGGNSPVTFIGTNKGLTPNSSVGSSLAGTKEMKVKRYSGDSGLSDSLGSDFSDLLSSSNSDDFQQHVDVDSEFIYKPANIILTITNRYPDVMPEDPGEGKPKLLDIHLKTGKMDILLDGWMEPVKSFFRFPQSPQEKFFRVQRKPIPSLLSTQRKVEKLLRVSKPNDCLGVRFDFDFIRLIKIQSYSDYQSLLSQVIIDPWQGNLTQAFATKFNLNAPFQNTNIHVVIVENTILQDLLMEDTIAKLDNLPAPTHIPTFMKLQKKPIKDKKDNETVYTSPRKRRDSLTNPVMDVSTPLGGKRRGSLLSLTISRSLNAFRR